MHAPTAGDFRTRLFQAITDWFPTHRIQRSVWARAAYRLLLELVRPTGTIVLRTPDYRIRYTRLPRRQIARYIAIKRAYEPFVTELMRQRAARGGLIVDAGANIGHFTLVAALAAGANGHVLAVEPAAEVMTELQANVALNGLHNVTFLPAALGAAPGKVTLYHHRRNPGGHSLGEPNVHGDVREATEVELVPLDSLVAEKFPGQRVSLIKVDTEGSEAAVLAGASEVLRTHQPALIIEYWAYGLINCGHDPAALLEQLDALGYRLWNLEQYETVGKAVPITVAQVLEGYTGENYRRVAYLLAEAGS